MSTQRATEPPDFSAISVSEHFVPDSQGMPDVRVLVYLPTNVSTSLPALVVPLSR